MEIPVLEVYKRRFYHIGYDRYVNIPVEIQQKLGLKNKDKIAFLVLGTGQIVIRKAEGV